MAINMGTAIAYLELDTSRFSKGFSSAFKDLKVFGDKTAKVEGKLKGLQSAFGTVGSTLSKSVTLPIAGIGAAALKSGTDFESAMSQVAATMGTTKDQIQDLTKFAQKMGSTTVFSAKQAADGLNILAMSGLTAEEQMAALPDVLNLASAGALSLDSAASYVTGTIKGFGDSCDNATYYTDLMAKGATLANTNVNGLGEALSRSAATANSYGQNAESVALSLLRLAEQNITGAEAATALNRAMMDLYTPTDNAKVALDELGISAYDASGTARDFNTIVDELNSALSGMSDEQANTYKNTIFTTYGLQAFNKMTVSSTKKVEQFKQGLADASGSAMQQAQTQLDNLKGDMTLFQSALEGAGIAISNTLIPMLRDFVKWLTDLTTKFNELSPEMQDKIVKIGLIVAAIGPLFLVISKLIGMIKTTISVFKFLAFAITTPVGAVVAIIAAIAALVAAFMYLWKNSETFRNYWIGVWNTIKETVISAWESIKGAFEAVKTFFTKTIPETFNSFVEFISGIVQSVIEFFTVTIPEAFINFATVTVPQFIEDVETFFKELPYKLGFIIGQVIGNIYLWAVEMKEKAKETGEQFVENVVTFFKELPEKISNFVKQIIENISQWSSDMKQKAIETGTNFIESVVTFFQELPGKVYNFITDTFKKVSNWGSEMKQSAVDTGTSFLNSVVEFFSQLPSKIWEFISSIPDKVREIGESLKQAGKDIFNKLLDGIKSVAQDIVDFVKGIAETIEKFVDGIKKGFKSVVDGASEAGNATKSVSGSHANGLSYVPYNGYVAKLHEGERVLTKQQNEEYNKRNEGQGGDTFNFYNTQPTPYEYARQMKKAKEELLYGL